MTVLEVGREAGMTHVSRRTLSRALNEVTYYRLTAIRKGVLSVEDRKKCVQFARDALTRYDTRFWSDKVLLYLDGVSVVYKVTHTEKLCQRKGRCIEEKMKDVG